MGKKITSYTTGFSVGVDFEKAGVRLEDVTVEGTVRFSEDGTFYDKPMGGTGYHSFGWGIDEIKTLTASAYSERRKAWVTVSPRLAWAIYRASENYINGKIDEQQGK